MNNQSLIYKLLARALLDIRIAALEARNNAAFNIADLFHNIPYQLASIQEESGDFQEILDWLEMRSEQKGMSTWLATALRECREE